MTNELCDFDSFLNELNSGRLLALLTPAELAEVDALMQRGQKSSLQQVVSILPVSVVRLLLDTIRAMKAETKDLSAKPKCSLVDLVRRLPVELQGPVADALLNGRWRGEPPAPLAASSTKARVCTGTIREISTNTGARTSCCAGCEHRAYSRCPETNAACLASKRLCLRRGGTFLEATVKAFIFLR
jgi:hypothetical protein